MPRIIEDTQLQELNNRMKELLSSYGADKLTLSIQSLPLQFHPSQKTTNNECDPLLAEAVDSFFVSGKFLELSRTSQTTYQSEMKLFLQYVQQHLGNNTPFISITNGEILSDYINQYSDQNTKAKKCAFLRTFIKKHQHTLRESESNFSLQCLKAKLAYTDQAHPDKPRHQICPSTTLLP